MHISKNYGVVNTVNWNSLTDQLDNYLYNNFERKLIGSSKIPGTLIKTDALSFNNYNPGDEYHQIISRSCHMGHCGNYDEADSIKTTILTKDISADSLIVTYTILEEKNHVHRGLGPFTYQQIISKTTKTIQFKKNDAFYTKEISGLKGAFYFNPQGITFSGNNQEIYSNREAIVVKGYLGEEFYLKEIYGGPFYGYSDGNGYYMSNSPVYYKNSEGTWGTPFSADVFILTSTEKKLANENFKIYPNPSQDLINIKIEQAAEVTGGELYSSDGVLIKHLQVADDIITISKSETGTGLFIVKFNSAIGSNISKISFY